MTETFIVENADGQERADLWLTGKLEDLTRSHIRKLIDQGKVTVNGKNITGHYRMKEGDLVLVTVPEPEEADIIPENIPLDILYEDSDVILINKPKGMVVHPAAGHSTGTIVNALMFHCRGNLSGINGVMRPGIVHRIDRDTTGVIIACKNDHAHNIIAAQLKEHSVRRKYLAIACGVIKEEEGTVDSPISRNPADRKKMKCGIPGGKRAVTHYRVLERFKDYTYIECSLETGRTHQIRVHMASPHHPLLGDSTYGAPKDRYHLEGQTLHAEMLGFIHPSTGKYMEFHAPLPDYFRELLAVLPRK
jgi:23S rRNA pseudouridine1911/1915/1917 synthase